MTIPAWQLAIRFGLEVGSLIAIGRWAGTLARGPWDVACAWGVPALVALLWVTFAVKGDPSRSGNAPVPVPGAVRFALELAVFAGGGAALLALGSRLALVAFLVAFVVHHAMTTERIAWLLRQ